MAEFHSFKSQKTFSGKNMDIFIESDYPIECFGAPKQFVAYLITDNGIKALCACDNKKGLLKELYQWKDNNLVYQLIKNDIKRFKELIE